MCVTGSWGINVCDGFFIRVGITGTIATGTTFNIVWESLDISKCAEGARVRSRRKWCQI